MSNEDLRTEITALHATEQNLREVNAQLLEALKAATMPLSLYNAYGWPDRDGVRGRVKDAIANAERIGT